jgi:PPOX class probable F420-dependent enzyme
VKLSDEAIEWVLDQWPVARLATLGNERQPHVVPIVFARVAARIWSPIDGKPKAGAELARIRNVRRDSQISLLFDHYDPDGARLWWVRADGEAEVRTPADPEGDPEVAAALAALRRKYRQYDGVSLLGPSRTLLVIDVKTLRSWCASAAAFDSLG